MARMINKDAILIALKSRMHAAERRHDRQDMALTSAVTSIIRQMPESEIMEGVICETCWWYNAERKCCMHQRGLPGRVLPKMFCSYGSKVDNGTGEEPDEEFNDFEED